MKTIFVLNTGSSSVKASLLCLSSSEPDDWKCEPSSQPKRIVTAHAEKLGTEGEILQDVWNYSENSHSSSQANFSKTFTKIPSFGLAYP